jgi:hypothetical protein
MAAAAAAGGATYPTFSLGHVFAAISFGTQVHPK